MTEDNRPASQNGPGEESGKLGDATVTPNPDDIVDISHGHLGADELAAWDQVIDDMEATVDEYQEQDWDVLAIYPGDVAVLSEGTRVGLDILIPNDKYERLESLLSNDVDFEESQVFRAIEGSTVFLIIAVESPDTETAVVYPAYYNMADPDVGELLSHARAEGELCSYLRVLGGKYIELSHEDPSLFLSVND